MPVDTHVPTRKRVLIQWLVLILVLSVLGVTMSVNMVFEHRYMDTREQDKLSVQAKVIAQNMALYLASSKQALDTMLGEVSDLDTDARVPLLKFMVSTMPGTQAIGILDERGNLLASNRPENIGLNFGGRDYFQTVKSKPDADVLYISRPFRSVIGAYSINLARAVLGQNGEFRGLVYAILDNQYFETLMRSVLYAPDMWAAIMHSDGPLFLRQPDDGDIAGSDLSRVAGTDLSQGDTLFSRHLASDRHATVQYGLIRGQTGNQIVALYTAHASGLNTDKTLIVMAGRDTDQVFAHWRGLVVMRGLFFFLIASLSIAGLAIYQQRQRVFDTKTAAALRALRAKDEDYRLIVEGTNDLVIKFDIAGRFTYANSAFCTLFGLTSESLIGLRCKDQPALAGQCIADDVWPQLLTPPYSARYRHSSTTANGLNHIDWNAQALRDDAGIVTGVVSIGHNITEHITLTDALKEQAQRDPLTGLANRRYLLEKGHTEQMRASRYGHPLSALMLDLDHFKRVNDTYGHKIGDVVLQTLGALLLANKREADIAARYGGEEFVVLLPDTNLAAAIRLGERLRVLVEESAVVTDAGETIRYTTSVGVAQMGGQVATLEQLLEQADQALYQAKRTGRNKVCTAEVCTAALAKDE